MDFHQDAYSRFSLQGCGEGFPAWAVTPNVRRAQPLNDERCRQWGISTLLDPEHYVTWRDFHRDTFGAQTRFLAMVREVSDRVSRHSNVIGYDLINEPFGLGDELPRLFDRIGAVIRERDPERILFIPGTPAIPFISRPTGDAPEPRNAAFAPHHYDFGVMQTRVWWRNSPAPALDRLKAEADARHLPMLLGEFGAPADTYGAADFMDAVYDWLDSRLVSGLQWAWTSRWSPQSKDGWNAEDLSIVDAEGKLRPQVFRPRPAPQVTAGTPLNFQRSASGFTFGWENLPALGDTRIFLPQGYAHGKQLLLDPANPTRCQVEVQGQVLICSGGQPGPTWVKLSE